MPVVRPDPRCVRAWWHRERSRTISGTLAAPRRGLEKCIRMDTWVKRRHRGIPKRGARGCRSCSHRNARKALTRNLLPFFRTRAPRLSVAAIAAPHPRWHHHHSPCARAAPARHPPRPWAAHHPRGRCSEWPRVPAGPSASRRSGVHDDRWRRAAAAAWSRPRATRAPAPAAPAHPRDANLWRSHHNARKAVA